jgi:RNA polymerase sigma-70 factor (ECF subfamily)
MLNRNQNDQELIRHYISGNESAIEILINRHRNRIFSYIVLLVKDRELADDIFQDAFIKVIKTLKSGSYNEEGKFLPWVMRIAHNLAIDSFRRDKRMPTTSGGDDYDIFDTLNLLEENVEDKMIKDQIHADIRKLVEKLPEEQREVLIMRHYEDMSFKEISETTNVSINTALGRMRYALINLRKLVADNNIILSV